MNSLDLSQIMSLGFIGIGLYFIITRKGSIDFGSGEDRKTIKLVGIRAFFAGLVIAAIGIAGLKGYIF